MSDDDEFWADLMRNIRPQTEAEFQAEIDAIEPEPMEHEQIEHIVRSAVHAKWCDGCGDDRPFDPERPDAWTTEDADGCLWNYCVTCTRRRKAQGL